MPKKPQKPPDPADAIQFRPGEPFGRLIAQFCLRWNLPRPETARRLALLAAHDFRVAEYTPIAELAVALGGAHDFLLACQQLQGAVHGANQAGGTKAYETLSASEKLGFLSRTVHALLAIRSGSAQSPQTKDSPSLPTEQRHIDF